MKHLLLVFSLLISSTAFSQYYSSYQTLVPQGESFQQGELRVKFIKVLSDSRCPKSVTCVQAGEAVALVGVYRGRKLIEKKKLVFPASGAVSMKTNLLFSDPEIRLSGMALLPYPEIPGKIPQKTYSLEIKVN